MNEFRGSRLDKFRTLRYEGVLFKALPDKIDTSERSDDIFYTPTVYDTLPLLAERFLEDARRWWIIAEYNSIIDPFASIYGMVLRIPSLSTLYLILI